MKTIFAFVAGFFSTSGLHSQVLDSTILFLNDSARFRTIYSYDASGRVETIITKNYPNGMAETTREKLEYAYQHGKPASLTASQYNYHEAKYDTSYFSLFSYDSIGRSTGFKFYLKTTYPGPRKLGAHAIKTYNAEGELDTLVTLYYATDTTLWSYGYIKIYQYDQSMLVAVLKGYSPSWASTFPVDRVDSFRYAGNKITRLLRYGIQNNVVDSFPYNYAEYFYDNSCSDEFAQISEKAFQGNVSLLDTFFYYRSDCLLDSVSIIRTRMDSIGVPYEDTLYQLYYYTDTTVGILSQVSKTNNSIRLYPNPASSYIMLSGYIPENTGEARIEFYDMQGKLVRAELLKRGLVNEGISTKGFKTGVYAYRVCSEEANISVGRIFIEP